MWSKAFDLLLKLLPFHGIIHLENQGSAFAITYPPDLINEDMELHFLEVPTFQKKPVSEMTSVERWLAYFSNKLDAKEMEELAMNEVAIQTALDAAAIFMQNRQERLDYLNREMAIMDYESDKDAWIEEGKAEGRAEGEQIGEKHGLETAARGMKAENIPIETIVKITGLTPEQVAAL